MSKGGDVSDTELGSMLEASNECSVTKGGDVGDTEPGSMLEASNERSVTSTIIGEGEAISPMTRVWSASSAIAEGAMEFI